LTDTATLAHLLKYDSVLGRLHEDVEAGADFMTVGGQTIKVFAQKDPGQLDWESVGAQVVIESTGRFTDANDARKHLRGPVVLGVNDNVYDAARHNIISNASCTTNCLAPVVKVLHAAFGILKGIDDHDPQLHERSERARLSPQGPPPRRRRRAQHDPHHHRRRQGHRTGDAATQGQARRLLDARPDSGRLRRRFRRHPRKERHHGSSKCRAESRRRRAVVSTDMLHNPNSSIVDAQLTKVLDGNLLKVVSWYDNEWGYSCRVVDLAAFLGAKGV
jgi:glyceraldehyde 3-phosphate dehydrogenase